MQSTEISTCGFDGCMRRIHARGLCNSHYAQQCAGRPLTPLRKLVSGSLADRLAAYTERTDDCWNWTGGVSAAGYGRLAVDGQMRPAHRLAYEVAVGPIPDGAEVDHRCHNTLCVRPGHLQAVTPRENQENRSGATKASKTGIRGVYLYRRRRRDVWVVKVGHAGRLYHGGTFDCIEDAERAAVSLRTRLHRNNLVDQVPASGLSRTTL